MLSTTGALVESAKLQCWQLLSKLEMISEDLPPFSVIRDELRDSKDSIRNLQKTLQKLNDV